MRSMPVRTVTARNRGKGPWRAPMPPCLRRTASLNAFFTRAPLSALDWREQAEPEMAAETER